MMISQPAEQRHKWEQRDRDTLEAAWDVHSTWLQDFPERKCQRRDDCGFLAQHGQTKSKLGWPNSVFDIKPDSPKGERGCHKVCMRQRTLYKEDWIDCRSNGCGHGNTGSGQASREKKDVRQGEGCQKQHRDAGHYRLPAKDGEP